MPEYEVVVGNIGTVLTDSDLESATLMYEQYVKDSKSGFGRASGESVYLMKDGSPIQEYQGPADDEPHDVDGCDDPECKACN